MSKKIFIFLIIFLIVFGFWIFNFGKTERIEVEAATSYAIPCTKTGSCACYGSTKTCFINSTCFNPSCGYSCPAAGANATAGTPTCSSSYSGNCACGNITAERCDTGKTCSCTVSGSCNYNCTSPYEDCNVSNSDGCECDTTTKQCVGTACLLKPGQTCSLGSECASGFCVDNVCQATPAVPTVTTNTAGGVTSSSATLNGNITATGGQNADLRGFEWGTTSGSYPNGCTDAGVNCEGTSGSYAYGVGVFSKAVTGLSPSTTYYFRAKARNSAGWGRGSEMSFTTPAIPVIPNVSGWAWSANIGWISFSVRNCDIDGDGTYEGAGEAGITYTKDCLSTGDCICRSGAECGGSCWLSNCGSSCPDAEPGSTPTGNNCVASRTGTCECNTGTGFCYTGRVCSCTISSGECAYSYSVPAGCPIIGNAYSYGVRIDPLTGVFSGYAWSENIGWISFAPPPDYATYPGTGYPNCTINGTCPVAPNYSAKIDFATGKVTGWARACAGTVNGDCNSPTRTDGWDGWILLGPIEKGGTDYGVNVVLGVPLKEFKGKIGVSPIFPQQFEGKLGSTLFFFPENS